MENGSLSPIMKFIIIPVESPLKSQLALNNNKSQFISGCQVLFIYVYPDIREGQGQDLKWSSKVTSTLINLTLCARFVELF